MGFVKVICRTPDDQSDHAESTGESLVLTVFVLFDGIERRGMSSRFGLPAASEQDGGGDSAPCLILVVP